MIAPMFRGLLALTLALSLWATTHATAQDEDPQQSVWIQIESYPALAAAEPRARAYAQLLNNVGGYRAGAFYAIALGPYPRREAEPLMDELRGAGAIPEDSFIQDGTVFTAQFFPIGTQELTLEQPLEEATDDAAEADAADDTAGEADTSADTVAGDETQAEATATETTAEDVTTPEPAPEAVQDGPVIVDATEQPDTQDTTGAAADTGTQDAPEEEVVVIVPTLAPTPEPEPEREETVAEARASEGLLTRPERDELQIALQFFDFYRSGIDGAFGPGTRNAMSAWQADRGFEATGVLTTSQRAQLLGEQAEELARLGLEVLRDEEAGIEVLLPLGMVAFDSYNFPFAQYEAVDDSGLRVLLISQPGDRATLFGLYEIMQTLRIVPQDGARERGRDSFLLTGQSANLRSHTEARLVGGAVKGFTLIWEPQRDEDMEVILPAIQDSIAYFTGALDPAFVPEGAGEDIDLVSGLEVRRPNRMRSGFYVDGTGTVLTTIEAITTEEGGTCESVLIDNAYPSVVSYTDATLGLAVLRPTQALAPLDFARLSDQPGNVRSEIAVAGFPFDGALTAASTSFGTLDALSGVDGGTSIQRLGVRTARSEAGAPVIDMSGNVIGMVLPGIFDGRALPDEVTLALRIDQLGAVFEAAGVALTVLAPTGEMNRETVSRLAADIAVRVSCWN